MLSMITAARGNCLDKLKSCRCKLAETALASAASVLLDHLQAVPHAISSAKSCSPCAARCRLLQPWSAALAAQAGQQPGAWLRGRSAAAAPSWAPARLRGDLALPHAARNRPALVSRRPASCQSLQTRCFRESCMAWICLQQRTCWSDAKRVSAGKKQGHGLHLNRRGCGQPQAAERGGHAGRHPGVCLQLRKVLRRMCISVTGCPRVLHSLLHAPSAAHTRPLPARVSCAAFAAARLPAACVSVLACR